MKNIYTSENNQFKVFTSKVTKNKTGKYEKENEKMTYLIRKKQKFF